MNRARGARGVWAAIVAMFAMMACAPSGPKRMEIPVNTDSYAIRVAWGPGPAYAREPTVYRVVVRDKKTGEPIEGGEGRVFASNADGQKTYDILTPTEESGTYTARLRFVIAGDWALSIQFRRDSTSRLERPAYDWRQTVHNEREQ